MKEVSGMKCYYSRL